MREIVSPWINIQYAQGVVPPYTWVEPGGSTGDYTYRIVYGDSTLTDPNA
jgi:hypothetical protein